MKCILFITCVFLARINISAQKAAPGGLTVAFWNVENLYDTINDPLKEDDEFTPEGKLAWTGERYEQKIERLAKVLSDIDSEVPGGPLALIGLCEIENVAVLNDLVRSESVRSLNLQPLLIEGPDARGVDVALLYRKDLFELKRSVSYTVILPVDTAHKTRGILVASGLLQGQSLCVIVNHWPSRRGGEIASRPNRLSVAKKVRAIYDSITVSFPGTRVLIMGDFNDDPVDESVRHIIGTVDNYNKLNGVTLFNPMEKLFNQGLGTLAWRDNWNLFDQVLINEAWKKKDAELYFAEARIFNKKYLISDHGNYRNYPFRTYSGGSYTGGYSDHFPVFLVFRRTIQPDKQGVK